MTFEELAAIVLAAGETTDEIEAIARISDREYLLDVRGVEAAIDLVAADTRVIVSATVGRPVDARVADVNAFLLSFARGWTMTGGLGFAAGPDGTVEVFYAVETAGLDAGRLAAVIVDMAAKAIAFRLVVEAGAADPLPVSSETEPMLRI